MWPVTEAFNRAHIGADHAVYAPDALPAWAATDDRLEATQADADAAAKRFWQRSSWYRRASIRAESLAGQPVMDDLSTQGAVLTGERRRGGRAATSSRSAGSRTSGTRCSPRPRSSGSTCRTPCTAATTATRSCSARRATTTTRSTRSLRREINRLEPQKVYLPLGVGNHVDHQLCRNAGIRLLAESRKWVMPGPEYAGIVTFYEDFPYAWWQDFSSLGDLPADALLDVPGDIALTPDYAEISDQIERKIEGITLYESQLERLFGGSSEMARQVRAHARKVALLGGIGSSAERYWSTKAI